jgi:glycosyltransferase involved in cell wall biosynthesis
MRIALISTPFAAVPPRQYGGTELVVYELAEGLVARGHDVTVYATGDSRTAAHLRAHYSEPKWPPDPFSELVHGSWAFQDVARRRFDVVHANAPSALALARLVPDVPVVYTIHHHEQPRITEFYRQFPEVWYVAISADQRARQGTFPRMTTIHHGLDPARYACTDTPRDYACFVGRLAPEKGPHIAVDVAAAAGIPIRLAGEVHPADREFGRAEVEPRLAQPHVAHLGAVDAAAKVPLLRDARALLAPITWHEPFGLIIIEAMLSGCPVLAFPMGSTPELIEQGVTGYVVRDAERMAAMLRPGSPLDQFDRHRCRARAVQRFSRARMVAEHEALYAQIVAEDGGRRPRIAPVPAA